MINLSLIMKYFLTLDSQLTKPVDIYVLGGTYMSIYGLKSSTPDIDLLIEKDYSEIIQAINKIKKLLPIDVDVLTDRTLYNLILPENFYKRAKRIRKGRSAFKHIRLWGLSIYDIIISKINRWSNKDIEDIATIFKHYNIIRGRLTKRINSCRFSHRRLFDEHYAQFEHVFGSKLKDGWLWFD